MRAQYDIALGSSPERVPCWQYFPTSVLRQVVPARIHLLDQRYFLRSSPALELEFPGLCFAHITVDFKVDETGAGVLLREALDQAGFVLLDSLVEEACDANIKCSARLPMI
jgi:hypothetical protein